MKESESENQNTSIFSDYIYDSISYGPVKTKLPKLEGEVEEPTNYNLILTI